MFNEKVATILKALGNKTRFEIICFLVGKSLTVTEISTNVNKSMSAVSHQLKILKDAKLITSTKIGLNKYYQLKDKHVIDLIENLIEHAEEEDA